MNKKKKPHKWASGDNNQQFETPHSTKSIAYWLSQYTAEGILFVRTSLMLMYQQTNDEKRNGSGRHRNNRGFSGATRNLINLAKKCTYGHQLNSKELNEAREKLKKFHLSQLKKLWCNRYDRRKAA